ncbi:MAG: cation:proton antiporter [Clostridia bacterium]|nr:cation:proton antiporter [Clostridia bacterium]
MQILMCLSIALFAGLMLSRLAKKLNLPAVTAYLIAGVLIGPFFIGSLGIPGLGFNSLEQLESFSIISDVALGFIAFAIGNEFRLNQLKHIGKQATIIGIIQAVFTTLVVDVALVCVHFIVPEQFPLPAAIILGAVASATAPAATLMVVKQYKAKGTVTSTLLPVVALDDAVGLVLFAVSFGIAKAFLTNHISIISIIVEPIVEVILSLALGMVMGILFTMFEQFFHSRSKRLAMTVAFVFITCAISMISFNFFGVHIAFSSLLSCMMLGTVFCNICDFSAELMDRLDRWTAPITILFFVLSGAELNLSVLSNIIIVAIGIVYIAFRCFGKYFGARISATISHADSNVKKYLGITLFPQAGVALGMAIQATSLGDVGTIVANITLFSVLVYELFGPYLTKMALTKAGEIDPQGKVSNRIRHHKKGTHTNQI